MIKPLLQRCVLCLLVCCANVIQAEESAPPGPYDRQVAENVAKLADPAPAVRARAAEALGFLRAYRAETSLVARLTDSAPEVRRLSALSLAWCGGRASLAALLERLDDPDWLTRQAAHVALCNVTGLELPFNSLAPDHERLEQAQAWRDWWRQAPADRPPSEVLALLAGSDSSQSLSEISALGSTGYQPVPSGNLPDGTAAVSRINPGAGFVATPAAIPVGRLPTGAGKLPAPPIFQTGSLTWRRERGVRALGALGGQGATAAIIALLGPAPPVAAELRPMVRAGLRAVGRLREELGRDYFIRLLQNPMWARHAAEALGDVGDRRAVGPLLAAYARFAKGLDDTNPPEVPADDTMGFPSEDRMLETPYWIAYALCRLPLDGPRERQTLRQLAPRIMANLPGDHDAMMLYQPEAGHRLRRHLLERAGLRQEAAEQAFVRLGELRRAPNPAPELIWSDFDARRISPWLPCVCLEPEDLPRLLALLQHTNGWVRINAAKSMAWLGDPRAIRPIAETLAAAKAEGEYGYSRLFKDDEFDDPSPRWREALVRALGLLKATQHVALITRILDDERSVLEVRHAAAEALADIGNREALAVLQRTALEHPFGTVRQVARDALWTRGVEMTEKDEALTPRDTPPSIASTSQPGSPGVFDAKFDALLFIKGDNNLPNSLRTVEQADRWRQTYVVTDEGPSYRPGDNLYVLRPPRPGGTVTPLTRFQGGYVGEPEISWDGTQVIFTRREQDSLWWHLWRINTDDTHDAVLYGPERRQFWRQLNHGPPGPDDGQEAPLTHRVLRMTQPQPMPDGRIVVSTQGGLTLIGPQRDADFFGQGALFGHPQHEFIVSKSLCGLRRAALNDPHDCVAIQMHLDSQFDGLGFRFQRVGVGLPRALVYFDFGFLVIHRAKVYRSFPHLTAPCYRSETHCFHFRMNSDRGES